MMSADKKSNSYTCQEWIQRWLIPLVDAMKCQPDCHKNVSQVSTVSSVECLQ